jgi:hypothetical protein
VNEKDVPVMAPEFMLLLRFTYHIVPDGRPDSVKVTPNSSMNDIDFETELPFTVKDPEDGEGEYVLFDVATVYE